jgi:hypothetical protein
MMAFRIIRYGLISAGLLIGFSSSTVAMGCAHYARRDSNAIQSVRILTRGIHFDQSVDMAVKAPSVIVSFW